MAVCCRQTTTDVCKECGSHIECMVRCGVGLMVSLRGRAVIQLYHLETLEYLQDINVASAITRTLNGLSCILTKIITIVKNYDKRLHHGGRGRGGFLWKKFNMILDFVSGDKPVVSNPDANLLRIVITGRDHLNNNILRYASHC